MNFDLFKGALNETLQNAKQHMGSALEQAEQLLDGVDARLGDDEDGEFEAMVPPSGFEDGVGEITWTTRKAAAATSTTPAPAARSTMPAVAGQRRSLLSPESARSRPCLFLPSPRRRAAWPKWGAGSWPPVLRW